MRIALTGATGFLGGYLVSTLLHAGHTLRCWYREGSDRSTIPNDGRVDWVPGNLGEPQSTEPLVDGCDALVHAALWRTSEGFQSAGDDLLPLVDKNVLGTLQLFEAARRAGSKRVVFISSGAVHEQVLNDRPLDETHPLWPRSHYGAHKAAIEAFVSSYGRGQAWQICALRPTAIYGVAHPVERSTWFPLIRQVVQGAVVECHGGSKSVHAGDVAAAVALLLGAEAVAGEAYECCDRYIAQREVAELARRISGSECEIQGEAPESKNQIDTRKLRSLGLHFGGSERLRATVAQLVDACRNDHP